jgi:hypothetical protein
MAVDKVAGIAFAIVVLAGLSMAILYGDRTAQVIGAAGTAFTKSIKAATLGGGPRGR